MAEKEMGFTHQERARRSRSIATGDYIELTRAPGEKSFIDQLAEAYGLEKGRARRTPVLGQAEVLARGLMTEGESQAQEGDLADVLASQIGNIIKGRPLNRGRVERAMAPYEAEEPEFEPLSSIDENKEYKELED